jgi:hypothetical protein
LAGAIDLRQTPDLSIVFQANFEFKSTPDGVSNNPEQTIDQIGT